MFEKDNAELIKDYIKSDASLKIINSYRIINDLGFDVWSFKKLIFLEYCIKPFLQICEGNGFKCIFIDLFSSCGANKIQDMDVNSIGSPIISLLKGIIKNKRRGKNNKFYKWFFFEKNHEFSKALKERIPQTLTLVNSEFNENLKIDTDVFVINGDCNEKIQNLIDELKKEKDKDNFAILAFVDPYNFKDLKWETLKILFSLPRVDLIFNLPIQAIERGSSVCKNKSKYLSPSLVNLLNEKSVSNIPEKDFEKSYAKDLLKLAQRSHINYRDIGISVKSLENREIYRINLYTYSTPFSNSVSKKADQLDKLDSKGFKSILEQAIGKQGNLLKYIE